MTFSQIYLTALVMIISMMTILWIISIFIKNVSIVDLFWGLGFVICSTFYFFITDEVTVRRVVVLVLVAAWGLRLSIFLANRNLGRGEDPRYRKFRNDYGAHRYWWISFFQTFLLQGILMWLISAPLLGAQYFSKTPFGLLDYIGILLWVIGFIFEAVGDSQLARFRADISNKGKVLDSGLWHYTRHPNYFGEAAIWTGYALFTISAGCYLPVLSSVLMIALIIKVSGVVLLEKSLNESKPHYREYMEKTSAFIPWFPKK
jgi:steroid 5-alpha reductase family enzyme